MPARWKPLPPIAAALAAAAKADGVTIDGADAWGDPAAGCYTVRLALHGGNASTAVLADQVLADQVLASGTAGVPATANPRTVAPALTFSELVKPTGTDDVLAFSFTRAPYHGRVRARLGAGRVTALACFGNQREPTLCDAACTRMLQGAP